MGSGQAGILPREPWKMETVARFPPAKGNEGGAPLPQRVRETKPRPALHLSSYVFPAKAGIQNALYQLVV